MIELKDLLERKREGLPTPSLVLCGILAGFVFLGW
jgi:hypothetical protein